MKLSKRASHETSASEVKSRGEIASLIRKEYHEAIFHVKCKYREHRRHSHALDNQSRFVLSGIRALRGFSHQNQRHFVVLSARAWHIAAPWRAEGLAVASNAVLRGAHWYRKLAGQLIGK